MSKNLSYQEIEDKYIKAGVQGHYKFRTKEEIKQVLGIDIEKLTGFKKLSADHAAMLEKLVCIYINTHGLEAREEIKPKSIKREAGKFVLTFKDNTYSYLYDDGSVG